MDACRLKSQHPAGTLRDLRQQLGLSQAAFAALLGVSAESYRTWDTGHRSAPPPLMAKAADLARTAKGAALPLYIWTRIVAWPSSPAKPVEKSQLAFLVPPVRYTLFQCLF
jgi:transcriptional regulator with XRE-family HTH domain